MIEFTGVQASKSLHQTSESESVAPETLYQIEEPAAVAEFLKDNALLNDLLVEAYHKITEVFGTGARVKLELPDDPEFMGNPKLYAVILTPLAAEEAIALQARLDNTWWLDNLERANCKFNIAVEYV